MSRPLLLLLLLAPAVFAEEPDFAPQPPVQARSVAETLATFQLPPGYRLESVLSEPEIKEPTAIAFDGDGRMFVVEMRTYMQDIDGTGGHEPSSRVSLHEDTDNNGVYDKHTVFADHLVLPRMVLPLARGQAIIGETDTLDLYLWTDTDDDGVADRKERIFEGGPRGGNLEHQPSGLIWSSDNWLYTTYNAFRLRWTPRGQLIKEPTAPNGGQWGVSQDDWGKPWFVNAGGEQGPVNFQAPIAYGAFNVPNQFAPDFQTVWPLPVGLPDIQGGPLRFRPEDLTLNHFTATCGGEIYRGDRLPGELRGDLFFGEPVGRLVRQARIEVRDGLTYLSNPHVRSEFLRSTDPLFRPVQAANAPDGTLYFVDMYRGIIQEGNWVREGSYLRKVVQQYRLDQPVSRGRIWRLVHDTTQRGPLPAMSRDPLSQLVGHLRHPNGWWRDTAQKLIILKQDRSIVPLLADMAEKDPNPLARFHALWTLEGLQSATPAMVRARLYDDHPQVQAAAIRVSESLYKAGDQTLLPDIHWLAQSSDPIVAVQAFLTLKRLEVPDWKRLLSALISPSSPQAVKAIGDQILNPPVPVSRLAMNLEQEKLFRAGETTFQTLCAACHGIDGRGTPMAGAGPGAMLAPALAGSKTITGWPDASILVLLHGLVGEIEGRKYEGQMIAMATNDDTWIAGVLSYVRNSFGNRAGFVSPQDVAQLRADTKSRTQPWTIAELRAQMPQALTNREEWKLTASHGEKHVALAVDGKPETRYSTNAPQVPGMWVQVELPEETLVSGVELESLRSAGDSPDKYTVELSTDGQHWGQPVAEGAGSSPVLLISFSAAKAKYIRITQTGELKGRSWSIHELQVFTPPGVATRATAKTNQ